MRQSSVEKRLQLLLDNTGYTQKDFAVLTSTTQAAICRYLRGTRVPSSTTLTAISDATGVSPNWLLGYGPDAPMERM